jgi:hypothetical protein
MDACRGWDFNFTGGGGGGGGDYDDDVLIVKITLAGRGTSHGF